jgi:hypothetical protein
MSERKPKMRQSSRGLWYAAAATLSHLGEALLDMLVPAAQAQGNLTATGDPPTVFFEDEFFTPPSTDWEIQAGGEFGFFIIDNKSFNGFPFAIPFEIDHVPGLGHDLAFWSDLAGDVSLAGDAVLVQRANQRLGVGTIAPTTPIHVMKADGTAKILAEETSTTFAPRNMFELINNGPVGFNMTDTGSNNIWRFAAFVDGFRINIADAGDLGPEMIVFADGSVQMGKNQTQQFFLDVNGNMTVQGNATAAAHLTLSDVKAKEDLVELEGAQVLAKLSALPVTEWSFKGDPVRHIGPTAQHFKAAFGLGADDTHIATLDLASVAVVGVKALHKMIAAREATITQQQTELAELKQRLGALEAAFNRVLAAQGSARVAAADTGQHH